MCKVDSLCYCLFAVGGGPLHPPIPLDGVLALSFSSFLTVQSPSMVRLWYSRALKPKKSSGAISLRPFAPRSCELARENALMVRGLRTGTNTQDQATTTAGV